MAQADAWLERLEMAGKRGAYAEQLSGGQRRKVSLTLTRTRTLTRTLTQTRTLTLTLTLRSRW